MRIFPSALISLRVAKRLDLIKGTRCLMLNEYAISVPESGFFGGYSYQFNYASQNKHLGDGHPICPVIS